MSRIAKREASLSSVTALTQRFIVTKLAESRPHGRTQTQSCYGARFPPKFLRKCVEDFIEVHKFILRISNCITDAVKHGS